MWWKEGEYKGIIHCERQRGEWNPDWTEPTRVVRQSRRWKPAQSVQVSREKCFLDSFEMICEAMKVTATAYGSGHGHFNSLSPRVLCWSMKIKTTRLLWQECGTNQCQKSWRSSTWCLDLDVWMLCERLFCYVNEHFKQRFPQYSFMSRSCQIRVTIITSLWLLNSIYINIQVPIATGNLGTAFSESSNFLTCCLTIPNKHGCLMWTEIRCSR